MEHTSTSSTKETLVRLFAIVGLFVIGGLLLWLAVQGIRYFPNAFSSLASILESVDNYGTEEEFLFELEKTIVNSGDTVALTWTHMHDGSYTFQYTCVPGTALKVESEGGVLRDMSCLESLSLPTDATGLFLSVTGDAQRFSDIPFVLTYTSDRGEPIKKEGRITVVNATAHPVAVLPETEVKEDMPVKEVPPVVTPPPAPKPTPTPTPVVTPKPTTTVTPKPVTTTQTVTYMPVSNPNGFTDLRTTYLGVGTMKGDVFIPKATFDLQDTAALRFEVKNSGTKTSETFTYTLTLPGGMTYESDKQDPLKPNEKAVYTVYFEIDDLKAGNTTIQVEVDTARDTAPKNNDFSWSVKITN